LTGPKAESGGVLCQALGLADKYAEAPARQIAPPAGTELAEQPMSKKSGVRWQVCEAPLLVAALNLQSFALHLQLHLRILFEELRVSLAKHLCYPLVRYASGAEPGGVGRAKVVARITV
jgi:hypothetical protein